MVKCPKCQADLDPNSYFCAECGHKIRDLPAEDTGAMMTVGGMETIGDEGTVDRRATPQADLENGTIFADRYEIEGVVGRGGMGVVYKANDTLARKTVALKLIRSERLAGAGAVDRLISEGITARDIRHPNVVAVYDVGQADNRPFVSMEYLDGQSLRSWHRQKMQAREDIPLRVAARIIAETLDGLKAAHAAGIVHRDLKPENIILMGEPDEKSAPLKILDFGIARAVNGALDSGTGTGLGTPRYMAPEQITNPDTAGPSADLYSLSVIFYELLVDVLPQGHWQPPSGGRSDVPSGIDALIEKGLSNRPTSRPQTSDAYRKQLIDAVNLRTGGTTRVVTPPPPPPPIQPKPPIEPGKKSGPLPLILGLGGGLAAIVLIGVMLSNLLNGGGYPPDDPCENLNGRAYAICAGEIDDDEDANEDGPPAPVPTPVVTPKPTPKPTTRQVQTSTYASLNGTWDTGNNEIYNVTINSSGQFNGSGYSTDGILVSISGLLSGTTGTYTLSAPALGFSFRGQIAWDQGCHLKYQTYDVTGSYVADFGEIHVNHKPGGPCPS